MCWPGLVMTGSSFLGPVFGTVGILAGIFLILGPLLEVIFAIGALNLQSWAWYVGIISSGITVLGVIVHVFQGGSFWSALWGSIIPIIVFLYLMSSGVRKAFGVAT